MFTNFPFQTSLCEEPDGQKKSATSSKPKPAHPEREKSPSKTNSDRDNDMQNPFRTAVSMLLYKVHLQQYLSNFKPYKMECHATHLGL